MGGAVVSGGSGASVVGGAVVSGGSGASVVGGAAVVGGATVVGGAAVVGAGILAALAPSPPEPLVTAVEQPTDATEPSTTRMPISGATSSEDHHGT